MLKNRTWIVIILIFFLFCSSLCLLFYRLDTGTMVTIECPVQTYHYNLSTAPNQTIVINTEYGTNTIEIKDGRIRVSEADCPDRVCVNAGWTSSPAKPIVCLPHKLTITVEKEKNDGIDAIVQ